MLAPQDRPAALWVHRGAAPPMREFHRHDDLEVNVVLAGSLEYLLGGARTTVPQGSTAVFWAATPHRLLDRDPRPRTDVCWIHVPLAAVLRWSLPPGATSRLLAQETLVVATELLGEHVPALFAAWQRDLAGTATGSVGAETVLLEANALVLRILAAATTSGGRPRPQPDLAPVARMAGWLAEHFREPVGTADVARSAGLNANYATTLFRRALGTTPGAQLVRHRVAEAQRLLLTTSLTTTAVAHAAGFGSQSSLYAHFERACGCSPGAYRRQLLSTGDTALEPASSVLRAPGVRAENTTRNRVGAASRR